MNQGEKTSQLKRSFSECGGIVVNLKENVVGVRGLRIASSPRNDDVKGRYQSIFSVPTMSQKNQAG